jgi:hypothetical protein
VNNGKTPEEQLGGLNELIHAKLLAYFLTKAGPLRKTVTVSLF